MLVRKPRISQRKINFSTCILTVSSAEKKVKAFPLQINVPFEDLIFIRIDDQHLLNVLVMLVKFSFLQCCLYQSVIVLQQVIKPVDDC